MQQDEANERGKRRKPTVKRRQENQTLGTPFSEHMRTLEDQM